jgi:hypothetical protein
MHILNVYVPKPQSNVKGIISLKQCRNLHPTFKEIHIVNFFNNCLFILTIVLHIQSSRYIYCLLSAYFY